MLLFVTPQLCIRMKADLTILLGPVFMPGWLYPWQWGYTGIKWSEGPVPKNFSWSKGQNDLQWAPWTGGYRPSFILAILYLVSSDGFYVVHAGLKGAWLLKVLQDQILHCHLLFWKFSGVFEFSSYLPSCLLYGICFSKTHALMQRTFGISASQSLKGRLKQILITEKWAQWDFFSHLFAAE